MNYSVCIQSVLSSGGVELELLKFELCKLRVLIINRWCLHLKKKLHKKSCNDNAVIMMKCAVKFSSKAGGFCMHCIA